MNDNNSVDEVVRAVMRREVDAGTPLIVLTCGPDAYHILVDGVAHERIALIFRAALRCVDRHLVIADDAADTEEQP